MKIRQSRHISLLNWNFEKPQMREQVSILIIKARTTFWGLPCSFRNQRQYFKRSNSQLNRFKDPVWNYKHQNWPKETLFMRCQIFTDQLRGVTLIGLAFGILSPGIFRTQSSFPVASQALTCINAHMLKEQYGLSFIGCWSSEV